MGQEELVSIFRIFVDKIKNELGPLNLFMLLGDEDYYSRNSQKVLPSTYTALISATWLDVLSPRKGTTKIVDFFFSHLSDDDMSMISKITAINTKDPSVVQTSNLFRVQDGSITLNNCKFGNVIIPSAIIFEAYPD